jgi:Anti-sigma-K factor rskA/Putative zinc-finger
VNGSVNDRHAWVAGEAAAFVLGALTPEEAALVREHLATCAEPHPEIEELGGVVPYLAESVELVEPPSSLRDRVMAAAAADLAAGREGAVASMPAAGPAAEPAPREGAAVAPFPAAAERAARAQRRRRSPLQWVAGLAAVITIAALGIWNVGLQRDRDAAQAYERGLSAVLDVAGQPGSQAAILSPQEGGGPDGLGAVGADGRVAIVMRGLAPTTGSEVYEAWAIAGDGAPQPLGGFTVGPTGTGAFLADGAPAADGVTLALTREPAPGATTPTAPILSLGTTPGS